MPGGLIAKGGLICMPINTVIIIMQGSFKPFMNGPNWPKAHLNRANRRLKVLNQDPKNSII